MLAPHSIDTAFDDAKIAGAVRAHFGECADALPTPIVGGRYQLVERLGEGAFGSVYRAKDLELERFVALKTLELQDAAACAREGRTLAKLAHPNVVRIYDHGVAEDYWYLVLELLEGRTLKQWVLEQRPEPDAIVAAFAEAGKGLAAAHAVGLVHRDFKPSNVMVCEDGRVVVVDFGLARHLDSVDSNGDGLTLHGGTLEYMAPERLAGEIGDARSDQFSFCVALWEALAGAGPFTGADRAQRFSSVIAGPGRPPVGGAVGRALVRGLSKLPANRFESMDELLAAFERGGTARRGRPFLLAAAMTAAVLAGIGLLPDGPTTPDGVAEPGEATVDEVEDLLRDSSRHAALGESGRALDLLEQAERAARGDDQAELEVADLAVEIGDALLERGHRAAAAGAFAVAHEGYTKHGFEQLAEFAARRVSVAMDPPTGPTPRRSR